MLNLGPIGVFLLLCWFLYLQFGPKQRGIKQHEENVRRLEDIKTGVDDCGHQLRTLNSRMVKIEEWRDAHEKQDDERYDRHGRIQTQLEKEIERARDSVHQLRNELFMEAMRKGHPSSRD